MAIASIGSFLSAQNKLEESISTFATSADLPAGSVGVIVIAIDNITTTDIESTDISLVDLDGNEVVKWGEITNGQGAAGAGATCWLGTIRVFSTIPAGSYLSMTFSAPVVAKAVTGWAFSVDSGMTLSIRESASDFVGWYEDASWIASWALTGLENIEHLICRVFACESGSSFTKTAAFTAFTSSATTGTPADTNIMACGEWEIKTGTSSSTSNPSANVACDVAEWYIAFKEVQLPGDSYEDTTDNIYVSETIDAVVDPLVLDLTDTIFTADSSTLVDSSIVVKNVNDSIVCSDNAELFTPEFVRSLTDNITCHDTKTINDGSSAGTITLGGVNYNINNHPRIWLTPTREAALSGKRTPAGGYTNGAWARVSQRALAAIATGYVWNDYTAISDMNNCAIYWKATGNTSARDWAISALMDIPNHYAVTPICYIDVYPQYGTDNCDYGSISEQYFAFAYSTLHDVLSESQRQTFRDWMFGPFQDCVWSHPYSNRSEAPPPAAYYEDPTFNLTLTKCFGELIWGLACCDEDERGAEYVTYQYNYYVNNIQQNMINSYTGGHTYSGTQYGQQRIIPYWIHMMEALENSLQGFEGYESISGDMLKYLRHHVLPDLWMIHSEWQNGGANFSSGRSSLSYPYLIEKYLSDSTYGNDAKYLHKYFRDYYNPSITTGTTGYLDYQFASEIFTIWDPDAATLDYSSTDLAYCVENYSEWEDGIGTFFSRDAWSNTAANQDAVWCHLNCGAYWGDHQKLTTGSYKIFRDEDYIVMENYMNYAAQSASNANVIFVGNGTVELGYVTGGLAYLASATGNQAMMQNAVTDQPTFAYAMGNMDEAYSKTYFPVDYARRKFCHLRPVNNSNTYVVVLDTISTINSETKKLYIHVPIAPSVSGDDVTVTRTYSRGVFRKILPVAATVSAASAGNYTTGTTIPGESTDDPYRITVSAAAGTAETLLHVWAVGDTSITMPTTSSLSSTTPSGSLVGVLIDDQDMSRAFLGSGTNGTISATNIVIPVSYTSSNGCELIVADLTPGTGYSVSYAGSTFTLTVDGGSPYVVDSKGVFNYTLTGAQSDIVRNLTDNLTVSEFVSTFSDLLVQSITDNINATESLLGLLDLVSTLQDDISVSESVYKVLDLLNQTVTDDVNISDSTQTLVLAENEIAKDILDNVQISELRQVAFDLVELQQILSESMTVSDQTGEYVPVNLELSDDIDISETVSRELSIGRSVLDSIAINDSVLKAFEILSRSLSDSVFVGDYLIKDLFTFISNFNKVLTDNVYSRDVFYRTLSIGQQLSESATISDSVYPIFQILVKSITDTIRGEDQETIVLNLSNVLIDNLSVSELKTLELELRKSITDRGKISDSSSKYLPILQSILDNIASSDSNSTAFVYTQNIQDTIAIQDSCSRKRDLGLNIRPYEHLVLEFIVTLDPSFSDGESSLFVLNGNPDKYGYGITISWVSQSSVYVRFNMDGTTSTNYRIDGVPTISDGLPHKLRFVFNRSAGVGLGYFYMERTLISTFSVLNSCANSLEVKGVRIGGHYTGADDKGWQGRIFETRVSKSQHKRVLDNDSFGIRRLYYTDKVVTSATAKSPILPAIPWDYPTQGFSSQIIDINDNDTALPRVMVLTDIIYTEEVPIVSSMLIPVTGFTASALTSQSVHLSWSDPETETHQIQIWRESVF